MANNFNNSAPANPRMTAYRVLMQVEGEGGYSNISLDAALRRSRLEPRDRAFATRLVYGVLENCNYLDYIIRSCSNAGARIEPEIMCILRMALYQMTFLDTPDSAAVNESVNLAKKLKLFRATGFINGLLRNYIRGGKKVKLPDERKEPDLYLSVKYSCPLWIVELWRGAYGNDICRSILSSLAERPPIFCRVNTTRVTAAELCRSFEAVGVKAEASQIIPDCLVLENTGSVRELPQYEHGEFHVQDGSSQLCCLIAAPEIGDRVYDVCAAPGGKSFTMAELMDDKGEINSCDIHPHRVKLIADGAKRLGLDCIKAVVRDALNGDCVHSADLVLCDVPCSGLGIIRRKPDIRRRPRSETEQLPELQYKILENSSRLVKEGGRLVYSTCTLNPAENCGVIDKFLGEHPEFEPCRIELPCGFERALDEPDYMITVFPHMEDTDGFFISTVRRRMN